MQETLPASYFSQIRRKRRPLIEIHDPVVEAKKPEEEKEPNEAESKAESKAESVSPIEEAVTQPEKVEPEIPRKAAKQKAKPAEIK